MKTSLKYADGSDVILNSREAKTAKRNQEIIFNNTGYEVNITTLTGIQKRITSQVFFEVPPSDFLPVEVGDNAWSSNILTYREFTTGDDFATGYVDQASNDSRLATTDTAIDSITAPVYNWAKRINWNVMQLQQASKSGNWDIIAAKERSRKKNWDLGIQQTAFVGQSGVANCNGLFNVAGTTNNTTLITGYVNALSDAAFQTFITLAYEAYRANVNRTAEPTHFIMPESDYNGLISSSNVNFNIRSKLSFIEELFQKMTGNPNFKVLKNNYADQARNVNYGINKNVYTLLNYDPESIRMDIPVDYTSTIQNTTDGFEYQNVGYGQHTGVFAYRPLELMYFTWNS
jgi:hypothetical protein